MTAKIPDLHDKILTLLKRYTLSTREISQEIGTTYATTLKHLEILHASLIVENKVYGKTKVWSLKQFDPFELDLKSFLYLLMKKLRNSKQSYDLIQEILEKFYLNTITINKEELINFNGILLIKRYLELEKDQKWKEIEEYDIMDSNESAIILKIFDCKYKFGCCANLKEDNIEIFCIKGYKFPCLIKSVMHEEYTLELTEFSLDPSFCVIKLIKII